MRQIACVGLSEWCCSVKSAFFAIVDTSQGDYVQTWLNQCSYQSVCLYTGTLADSLSDAAPYLVALDELVFNDDASLKVFLKSRAIFFESGLELEQLRHHFRHFTSVILDGERAMFAFYDANVFGAFATAAKHDGFCQFMSPLKSVAVPTVSENGYFVVRIFESPEVACNEIRFPLRFSHSQVEVFDREMNASLTQSLTMLVCRKMKKSVKGKAYRDVGELVERAVHSLRSICDPSMASIIRFVSLSVLAWQPITDIPNVRGYLINESEFTLDEKLMRLSRHFSGLHCIPPIARQSWV